jgi:hypothetical protein
MMMKNGDKMNLNGMMMKEKWKNVENENEQNGYEIISYDIKA